MRSDLDAGHDKGLLSGLMVLRCLGGVATQEKAYGVNSIEGGEGF